MILRHLTDKRNIESILKDGFLKGSDNLRATHNNHVSFEIFNPYRERNSFIKAYALAKGIEASSVIELLFDAEKMTNAGIEIRDCYINGIKDTNIELSLYPEVTDEDLKSIGEYRFVHGNVSLEFLAEQTKREIFKQENF